jgi:hypothetical protein
MKMEASGVLHVLLQKQIGADPTRRCLITNPSNGLVKKSQNRDKDEKKPLTLKSLSGAFVVLEFGYSLGIAVFIVEIFYKRIQDRKLAVRSKIIESIADKTVKPASNKVKVLVNFTLEGKDTKNSINTIAPVACTNQTSKEKAFQTFNLRNSISVDRTADGIKVIDHDKELE